MTVFAVFEVYDRVVDVLIKVFLTEDLAKRFVNNFKKKNKDPDIQLFIQEVDFVDFEDGI